MLLRSLPAIASGGADLTGESPLAIPAVGSTTLRILSPDVLELSLITTKPPGANVEQWDFVLSGAGASPGSDADAGAVDASDADAGPAPDAGAAAAATADAPVLRLPPPDVFEVTVAGARFAVKAVGFKRRALYAKRLQRDLRIASSIILELERPIPEGAAVEVRSRDASLWRPDQRFAAKAERLRWSPAIHVNQVGYVPACPKKAIIGYFLGSLGELSIREEEGFRLVDVKSGREVFAGRLALHREEGFTYKTAPYQRVFEADFSDFKAPGEYRLSVPGLGASFSFFIDDGAAAAFARTYALGLYHQRCGAENALPFTRFIHAPCHTAPAEIPAPGFGKLDSLLARLTSDAAKNPKHAAPPLKNLRSTLYPFARSGQVDVSGGHHDAGDYSKYTINSAQLIHALIFAVDAFPGAGDLDNLGLPESGDGIGDLLQIARWEADFLAKMQDTDGGFYFLVYPRDRRYETDVLPDRGDPQIVFPKNTAATAAAVAALAQTATSPRFRKAFPADAARYLQRAEQGWRFLERAIAAHGKDASYQKITHYGDVFMHDDELAWAAVEMYLATGDAAIHQKLLAWLDPADRATRVWGWLRMFESYGAAVRSYAFAQASGRAAGRTLDPDLLAKCLAEVRAAAQDQVRYAAASAYATSFPIESKRFRATGWYFPIAASFDIAVAYALDPRPELLSAFLGNVSYEAGTNPNNVSFLTGLGWKRPREIVHQYAMNDRRVLPPSGIPVGSLVTGAPYIDLYKRELGAVGFPTDGDRDNPYPFYDRWSDAFNLNTEFVAAIQARALAGLALVMARTPASAQPYRSMNARIAGVPRDLSVASTVTVRLEADGIDVSRARIVWESSRAEPAFGQSISVWMSPGRVPWIEAEAQWPDGRRAFAVTPAPSVESLLRDPRGASPAAP